MADRVVTRRQEPAPGRRAAALSAVLRAVAPRTWFLEDEVAGLDAVVGPGAVCLDIGAEFGLYTWALAGLVGPTGAVHAVEPQPGLSRFIRTTARAVGADHVAVHRIALGAQAGTGTLSLPVRRGLPVHGRAFLTTGSTGLGSNAEFTRHDEVPVTVRTVDAFVRDLDPERLDFIKIDIEGAEASLLRGAEEVLTRFRPALMLELEDRHLARFDTTVVDVLELLAARGYRARSWWPGRGWVPHRLEGAPRNVLFVADERT